MLKKRISVSILLLAISLNLVACKSDNDKQKKVETTQANSSEIQGEVLNTYGNFTKILVSNSTDTLYENGDSALNVKNEEKDNGIDDTTNPAQEHQNSRPPIGLAVMDSSDRVDVEENKVIGSVDYDTIDISEFSDFDTEPDAVDFSQDFTNSMQVTLVKFDIQVNEKVAGYLKNICDRHKIDISTVESKRGLKVDNDLQYDIIVAYNEKYNIYLAINKEDNSAKYKVTEK